MAKDNVEFKEIKELERTDSISNSDLILIDDQISETKAITYENAKKQLYSDIYTKLPKYLKGIPEDFNAQGSKTFSSTVKNDVTLNIHQVVNRYCFFMSPLSTAGVFNIEFEKSDIGKEFYFYLEAVYFAKSVKINLNFKDSSSSRQIFSVGRKETNAVGILGQVILNGWYKLQSAGVYGLLRSEVPVLIKL